MIKNSLVILETQGAEISDFMVPLAKFQPKTLLV